MTPVYIWLIAALVTDSIEIQLLAFAVVSLLAIAAVRPVLKRRLCVARRYAPMPMR